MVPVAIDRADVRSRFNITYTEEDIGFNLSLQSKIKQDFGLTIPGLPDEMDIQLNEYYDALTKVIEAYERWEVDRSSVALGFFSFSTFLMYNDLLEESWAGVKDITKHPILNALLDNQGFESDSEGLPDDKFIDEIIDPEETHFVLDADSSQIAALLEANRGYNLVIQGPPGTGKSQTITNLIAESLGQGKKVLFVAEKMAALEVVKRRLDEIGLGKACLELHSHKTSKRAVLGDLQETLDLGRPQVREYVTDLKILVDFQDRLNAYVRAVNSPIGKSGVSPYQCYGYLLNLNPTLDEIEAPELPYGDMSQWNKDAYNSIRVIVGELEAFLKQMGLPEAHPFWMATPRVPTPSARRRFVGFCQDSLLTLSELQRISDHLSNYIGREISKDYVGSEDIIKIAQRIIEGPDLTGVEVNSDQWHERAEQIVQGIDSAHKLQVLHGKYDDLLDEEAWSYDVEDIEEAYAKHSHKWWRLAITDYRRARKALSSLCHDQLPKGVNRQLAIIKAIDEVKILQGQVKKIDNVLTQLYGDAWKSQKPDWDYLREVASWLESVHIDIEQETLSPKLLAYLKKKVNKPYLQQWVDSLQTALEDHARSVQSILSEIQLNEAIRFLPEGTFLALPYVDQEIIINDWLENVDRLQEIVTYNNLIEKLTQKGLFKIVDVADHWPQSDRFLVTLYDRTWYEALLNRAIEERSEELAMFDGQTHIHAIEEFCERDRLQFQYNRVRLADLHWKYLPERTAEGQMGILLHEFEKKRRHLPIRKLMVRAGNAIQAIKPVFMMSPISIATYLPPGSVEFDLVVFDEASQVKPSDALGAILRGKQIVVTGDSKQLPPTSFFQSIVELDEEEVSPTADLESILGLFRAQGAPERTLNWHYRSRHSSLIAVSNYEFYDNRLIVFPSPDHPNEDTGLIFHHLPDAVYDRGKSRTNLNEAITVAEAVVLHAHERPGWTLGVAAFSKSQSRAIQEQVELLRRKNPQYEVFFKSHPHEPFFIKNLENVQGDERDVIFISVGYGPDANGKMSMNFGPINRSGGERRLNVLITRARYQCEVYSSIRASDIDTKRTQSEGVRALKRFLKYAESRDLEIPEPTNRESDSPFEEEVAKTLRDLGYEYDSQVGSAGFFIDLAVKDTQHSGQYILGIECDGATYHGARSARDRDRLRQEVLENLGWRIYRIWSTDWFNHRDREVKRLIEAIEQAELVPVSEKSVACIDSVSLDSAESIDKIKRVEVSRPGIDAKTRPYNLYRKNIRSSIPLHEVKSSRMARWVTEVVEVESPIHIDELVRRITHAAGLKRSGSRIQRAVLQGVEYSEREGVIVSENSFLWRSDMAQPPVRDRSDLPATLRNIDLIAFEEIAQAIQLIVDGSKGIPAEDIPSAVCRLLGFGRTGSLIVARVEEVLERLLSAGTLALQNDYIILVNRG